MLSKRRHRHTCRFLRGSSWGEGSNSVAMLRSYCLDCVQVVKTMYSLTLLREKLASMLFLKLSQIRCPAFALSVSQGCVCSGPCVSLVTCSASKMDFTLSTPNFHVRCFIPVALQVSCANVKEVIFTGVYSQEYGCTGLALEQIRLTVHGRQWQF